MSQPSNFLEAKQEPAMHKAKRLRPTRQGIFSTMALSLLLLSHSTLVLAGGGHGGAEFSNSASGPKPVELDENDAKQLGITAETIARKQLAFGIPTTGQIEVAPDRKVAVTTPVTGTVVRFFVKPGDAVKMGDPVALLSSPELAELRVESQLQRAEANADVQRAEAALQRAQQNYERQNRIAAAERQQTKVSLSYAQERFDKDSILLERGAIPRRQLLDSQEKLAEVKADLARVGSGLQVLEAQEQLQNAQSDIQVAQSRVQLSSINYETRLRQLGSSANADGSVTIRAPISGIIADREATQGESAADPGKPLLTIVNDSMVVASANVYEKDLDQIRIGQRVRVTVASLPKRTFSGRVTVVGAAVQGQSRSLPVKAELDNSDGALKPGMFAKMDIVTDRTYAAGLAVPKSAIVDANGKMLVFHQEENNIYEPVEVTLGRTAGDLVEVKNGVEAGDRVVIQGTTLLYAQSIQGGSAEESEEGGEKPEAADQDSSAVPWWLLIPSVAAIAGGTFYLGRRSKPPIILRDPDYRDVSYKPEAK